jgi:large subunit ribosomal protein L22
MKAYLRQTRLSPKKTNLVASMIRGLPVNDALEVLEKLPKKGARILSKLLASAIANAEQNASQRAESLYIKELVVNKGPGVRRFIPIARGRARGIDKWSSHISLNLGVIVPEGQEDPSSREGQRKASIPLRRTRQVEKEQEKAKKASKKEEEKAKKAKEKADAEIEYGGPVSQAPGNPQKASDSSSNDPNAKGSDSAQGGTTFTPHRQGGRGE